MAKWNVSKNKSLHEQILIAQAKKSGTTKLWAQLILNTVMLAVIAYLMMKGF